MTKAFRRRAAGTRRKEAVFFDFMWSGLSVHACQALWVQFKSHLMPDSSMTNDDDQDETKRSAKMNVGGSCAVRRKPITSIERTRKLSILLKHHQQHAVSSMY